MTIAQTFTKHSRHKYPEVYKKKLIQKATDGSNSADNARSLDNATPDRQCKTILEYKSILTLHKNLGNATQIRKSNTIRKKKKLSTTQSNPDNDKQPRRHTTVTMAHDPDNATQARQCNINSTMQTISTRQANPSTQIRTAMAEIYAMTNISAIGIN